MNLDGFMRHKIIQVWIQKDYGILLTTFMDPFGHFHRITGAGFILPVLLMGHIIAAFIHRFKINH